ncbi:hypothetical protein HZS_1813 [Henneguya salminicola]|nr:hypothetical protein HZS_1813 [Henneguya salminicola]
MYPTILLLAIILLITLIYFGYKPRILTTNKNSTVVCVVMGPGGHCKEMTHYCTGFSEKFKLAYFLIAKKDYLTINKITTLMSKRSEKYEIMEMTRARTVNQYYLTSIITTLISFLENIVIFARIKPDILLCNGPGNCVPPAVACYLLQVKNFINVSIETRNL